MLRVLVVDDEAPARRRIRRLLAAEDGVTVVGECGDGTTAVAMIAGLRPDLVFLDVQMPERDGFEVVKAMPRTNLPAILFVTAYDHYALRAFDVHAVDYLLKPFTGDRFRTALARARERISRRAGDAGLATLAATLRSRPEYLTRLSSAPAQSASSPRAPSASSRRRVSRSQRRRQASGSRRASAHCVSRAQPAGARGGPSPSLQLRPRR